MPSLCITLPDNKGEITHELSGQRITIGRRPDNTIQIVHGTVCGYHAELIATDGHYRLHDLGATNFTFVDGDQVTDFHLQKDCKINFGTVECAFRLESDKAPEDKPVEVVPTRAELEFLRRENIDLQSKMGVMRKQIDILSAARLTTRATTMIVTPEVHRRVVAERDELRREMEEFKADTVNLKADLTAMTRDRDALRQAWGTLNAELTGLRQAASAGAQAQAAGNKAAAAEDPMVAAGGWLGKVLEGISAMAGDPANQQLREPVSVATSGLVASLAAIEGQAAQSLASKIDAFMREVAPNEGALPATTLQTLRDAAELNRTLLEPQHLARATEIEPALVLALDSDEDQVAMMNAALHFSDIDMSGVSDPAAALSLLGEKRFNLVLLDFHAAAPAGAEFCARLREIPTARTTPVIFYNATDTLEAMTAGKPGLGNDVLRKPLDIVEFTLKSYVWLCRDQFGLL